MNFKVISTTLFCLMVAAGCQGAPPPRFEGAEAPDSETPVVHENVLINLWGENKTSFGVYVPNEDPPPADGQGRGAGGERPAPVYTVEGGRKLAENPLYDFVFLNIEGNYDVEAVRAIGEGIRSPTAVGRKTFLVRIPTIERDGAELTKARVKEVLDLGADGVVIPHIRGTEEARLALSFFTDAGADVWSPSNRWGEVIAMLMLEDPGAIAQATEVADIEGISVLACGIGSLTGAIAAQMREGIDGEMSEEAQITLRGEASAVAEEGNLKVLAESKRVGIADMITANAGSVEGRVSDGFLALLMSGPDADSTIELGIAAAGRQ